MNTPGNPFHTNISLDMISSFTSACCIFRLQNIYLKPISTYSGYSLVRSHQEHLDSKSLNRTAERGRARAHLTIYLSKLRTYSVLKFRRVEPWQQVFFNLLLKDRHRTQAFDMFSKWRGGQISPRRLTSQLACSRVLHSSAE